MKKNLYQILIPCESNEKTIILSLDEKYTHILGFTITTKKKLNKNKEWEYILLREADIEKKIIPFLDNPIEFEHMFVNCGYKYEILRGYFDGELYWFDIFDNYWLSLKRKGISNECKLLKGEAVKVSSAFKEMLAKMKDVY